MFERHQINRFLRNLEWFHHNFLPLIITARAERICLCGDKNSQELADCVYFEQIDDTCMVHGRYNEGLSLVFIQKLEHFPLP